MSAPDRTETTKPAHPVAQVTHGEWGDDYPAIRLVGVSTLGDEPCNRCRGI